MHCQDFHMIVKPTSTELNDLDCRRVHAADSRSPDSPVDMTLEVLVEKQRQDEVLKPILEALLRKEQRPSWADIQSAPEETRALWAQYESLKIKDNLLQREFFSPDGKISHMQIIIPISLRQLFLRSLHETDRNTVTSHLGVRKTLAHVSQRAYWPSWRRDTEQFCRRCIICQSVQQGTAPRHGKMQIFEANGVGDRLHVDLTGPHPPSRQGAVYILTAIDAFSRFLTCVPIRNKTAVAVANALVEHVFLPQGCYQSIVSDQGREFCNELLDAVTQVLGIRKLRTTAYRPSANGRIERVHRTMNGLLSKVVSENQRDWQDKLPMITAAYNAAQHETTSYSPYYLVYGREYRTPLDLTLTSQNTSYGNTEIDYVELLQNRLKEAYETVNSRLKTMTQRMKKRYDAKVKDIQLEPGELVFYYCPRRKIGSYQKWRRLSTLGMIVKRFNDVLYSVKLSPRSSPIIIHADRLRRFDGETPDPWKAVIQTVISSAESSGHRVINTRRRRVVRRAAIRVNCCRCRKIVRRAVIRVSGHPCQLLPLQEKSSVGRPPVLSTHAVAESSAERSPVSTTHKGKSVPITCCDNNESKNSITDSTKVNKRTVRKPLRFRETSYHGTVSRPGNQTETCAANGSRKATTSREKSRSFLLLLLRTRAVPTSVGLSSTYHHVTWDELFVERGDTTVRNFCAGRSSASSRTPWRSASTEMHNSVVNSSY